MSDNRQSVSLFIPCLVDHFVPDIGAAAFNLLEKAGFSPRFHTSQTCCGQVFFNSGFADLAVPFAERFAHIFSGSEYIVMPSGSCAGMIRNHYSELPVNEKAWMKLDSIKGRIFELSEFLADVAKFPTMKMRNSGRIYYHGSCHLMREIGVKDQPLKLLRMIEGIEIAESSKIKECCGFGGIFCVKYPHVSEDITKRVLSETGNVDCIIVNDAGCLITMNAILPQLPELKKNIRILHLAEFLNESMKNSD